MALTVSTGATSALGLFFWIFAARLAPASQVGRAAAEVSAMTLLATLSQLNLMNFFTKFLPRAGNQARRLVVRGYCACFAIGVAASTAFLALGAGKRILGGGAWQAVLFVVAVGLWTVFVLQDSVLIGLRSAKWVPVENASFALAKLLLLLLLASRGSPGIFLAWSLPVLPVVIAVNFFIFARRLPLHQRRDEGRSELPGWTRLRSFIVAGYASSVIAGSEGYLLPLIVVHELGGKAEAYFYIPWLFGTVVESLFWNISTSFIVEAGYGERQLITLLRRSSRFAGFILLPMAGVILIGAPIFLRILGGSYGARGTTLLRLIALSVVPMAITVLYQTFVWYEGRLRHLVGFQCFRIALLLGVSISLLHRFGINAAGIGLLVSQGASALLVLPSTIGRWRALTVTVDAGIEGAS